ncbi:MAG: hypothetical protein MSA53_07210, partial [Bacteroidales bacterium]|nr:hypothetical protein [Bacteroidales bacterium]
KDIYDIASASGVKSTVSGTSGHLAKDLAYGEFLTSTAPEQGQVKADNPQIRQIVENTYEALCDDLNTPIALSEIFEAVKIINTAKDKKMTLSKTDIQALLELFDNIVYGVLGLMDEEGEGGKAGKRMDALIGMVLEQRKAAKAAKDWATSDRIRDELLAIGIRIKDTKDGVEWTME